MYHVERDGKFVIENYNWETSFSNFFPGIAGKFGIPLWAFYVSRAQGICSVGVRDKNNQIMEFLSFNRALQMVGSQGFRTFIKTGNNEIYEPFRKTRNKKVFQKMMVSSHELEICDRNEKLGIETSVLYYPIVNENFPAFARIVKIKNIGRRRKSFELIDGLPRILPYGIDGNVLHTTQRHIEGMIGVFFREGVPLFRLKQSPGDVEKVESIDGGNFYISFSGKKDAASGYIVDPRVVFGESEIYDYPWNFTKSLKKLLSEEQILQNKTSSAFKAAKFSLSEGKVFKLSALTGQVKSDNDMKGLVKKAAHASYLPRKRRENEDLINSIKDLSLTVSGDAGFDEYCRQTFLDNVIRGGMPVVFPTVEGKSAFYIYSRQNGDLERDYHFFVLEPTYFSQGTGHYRSVNQNRRCDCWFFPETADSNIKMFVNLIQTDGYNPLEITQMTYSVRNKRLLKKWLLTLKGSKKKLLDVYDFLIRGSFAPGDFLMKLESGSASGKNAGALLGKLLTFCAEDGGGAVHEGFWADHWLYNLDLIDNFFMIYPEKKQDILMREKAYYFYDDPDVVVSRQEKFVLSDGRVRQYNAVKRLSGKETMINAREKRNSAVRTKNGSGEIYRTSLLVKLLCMTVNRVATLDPAGTGIEMEADKPGWNDSVNGLPGIIGSSLCQTLELEKGLRLIFDNLHGVKGKVLIFEELYEFMVKLGKAASKKIKGQSTAFEFWDESHRIKEAYRKKTIFGVSGTEKNMSAADLRKTVKIYLDMVSEIFSAKNRKNIFAKNGVCYTYFENRVVKHAFLKDKDGKKKTNASGLPLVQPLAFKQIPLPLFLEGPVHMMKTHPEIAKNLYSAVKSSGLFDKKLKMYKVCESLAKAPFEIGRVKAWGSGWIENESVYTHMEYKYLLELLKSGLYDEFFSDIQTMLMPYLKPETYGRSVFENVSFIVSSAFPDKKMHGRGLQPRLSGVTGEMINMWILMTAGDRPFFIDGD
ncbi:MAG: cellobiose phosphorylase, partial [Elusimicrobiota bacterium]|nr:cellobiose phosphorylase [Elusimicrobiota bacterium]